MQSRRAERMTFHIVTAVFVALYVLAILVEWNSASRGMVFALIFNALVILAASRAPLFRDFAASFVPQGELDAGLREAALERQSHRGAYGVYIVLLGAAYAMVIVTTMGTTASLALFALVACALFGSTAALAVMLFRRPKAP